MHRNGTSSYHSCSSTTFALTNIPGGRYFQHGIYSDVNFNVRLRAQQHVFCQGVARGDAIRPETMLLPNTALCKREPPVSVCTLETLMNMLDKQSIGRCT